MKPSDLNVIRAYHEITCRDMKNIKLSKRKYRKSNLLRDTKFYSSVLGKCALHRLSRDIGFHHGAIIAHGQHQEEFFRQAVHHFHF